MINKKKYQRLKKLMEEEELDLIILSYNSNIAWLSSGYDNKIVETSSEGAVKLAVYRDKVEVITDNIEAERVKEEGPFANCNVISLPWHKRNNYIEKISSDYRTGSDSNYPRARLLNNEITRLRYSLLPEEITKYRELGKETAQVISDICLNIEPGQTEQEIKAELTAILLKKSIRPFLTIVGSDRRIYDYRHPISTDKIIENYVMIVVCAEREGLIVNLSRLLHFGPLTDKLEKKLEAVQKIDAVFINSTRPGIEAAEVFNKGVTAYKENGFPGEWKNHHQGGATGYETRDYIVNSFTEEIIRKNQAFTWNPSLPGVKSEDTILVGEEENEIITFDPDWPGEEVEGCGQKIIRPDIMIR